MILIDVPLNRTLIIFFNKLRFQYLNSASSVDNTTNSNDNNYEKLEKPSIKKVGKSKNVRLKTVLLHYLE